MNTYGWQKIEVNYLEEYLTIEVPSTCEILQMKPIPPLERVTEKIEYAFQNPIQSKRIEEIVFSHCKPIDDLTVAIVVSDNTRPVPYNCSCSENILSPILSRLTKAGIKKEHIKIIIGNGTHAPTSDSWKKDAFGEEVFKRYILLDHDCYSDDLVSIGTVKGIPVKINKDFIQSDIHIVTGLVETHFMAGASGGRKAICPGLVNLETTQVFHGPEFMANINADNLIFDNNPCHEFALEVAQKTRVDYAVNVLLNGEMHICGIYTGKLEESHQRAIEHLQLFSEINIDKEYDVVLTHGGKGSINHYQAVKGAWSALPAVKKGGYIILLAHNRDKEPIGSEHYKDLLKKLKEVGVGNFYPMLLQPDWNFTHDQWEVQKWEQVFQKIGGEEYLIYCTTNIPPEALASLPGVSGYQFTSSASSANINIATMLQQAIYHCVSQKENMSMAFLKEGPYLVLKK